jgi:hypothetical protein
VDNFLGLLGEAPDNDPPTVQCLLERTLLTEFPKYNAAKYLTPYGLDMPAFLTSREKFTVERWNELNRAILDFSDNYDVELIVAGWGRTQEQFSGSGNQAEACIFSVNRDGVTRHSDDGFYACGSGKYVAHSILSFFSYEPHMTLAEAVYYVAAAKFMSEKTEGVGPNTVLRVAKRLGQGEWRGYFIQPDEVEQIRRLWKRSSAPRMPHVAENVVVSIIGKHQKMQRVTLNHMTKKVNQHVKVKKHR